MSDIIEVPGIMDPQSLLALIWTTFSIAFIFVLLRTVIRFKVLGRLVSEDYWIFLAIATLLTNGILQTIQLPSLYYISAVSVGQIPETADLIPNGDNYVRFEFAIIGLFWTVLWCIKASFLSVYYKLFQDVPSYRIAWYILVVFTFLAYVGCWIASFMTCHPIADYFDFGQCQTAQDIWVSRMCVYYSTIIDIFTDLCIIAMPIKLIYNVQISVKQKAGLVGVFGLCLVMIIFAIIRAKQVLVAGDFPNLPLLEIWSTLESSISVVVGCLPAFKSLITNRAATKRSKYGYSGNGNKSKVTGNSKLRSTSIPLESFTNDNKTSHPTPSDSQEEMVKSNSSQAIMVKNDVTVSYAVTDSPLPIYDNHKPIPTGIRRSRH